MTWPPGTRYVPSRHSEWLVVGRMEVGLSLAQNCRDLRRANPLNRVYSCFYFFMLFFLPTLAPGGSQQQQQRARPGYRPNIGMEQSDIRNPV